MADIKQKLLQKFSEQNSYANFGAFIKEIQIEGFRGISNLEFKVEFPVTAISGTNGSGKSTIGQIAVCGYRKPVTDKIYKRRYVKDFFPQSDSLDPNPFTTEAKIIYKYATNTRTPQQLTIARKNVEWSGYKRQPERHCFYVGFAAYIPKIERRGISIYNSKSLELTERRDITEDIKQKVANILNSDYDEIWFQGITAKEKSNEIGMVSRYGYSYSENNMGFGEGRLLYIVDLMENEPDNSLFVLEEPETSLHGDAQYKFIKYLMDVSNRKGHQVILSTHSATMLEALPPEGRKFLTRDRTGVKILDRISAYRAKSILADGHEKALTICVEDPFAQSLLTELIKTFRPGIIKNLQIAPVGDKKAVGKMIGRLRELQIRSIAVRDADVGENVQEKLFCFPGTLSPEKEVFLNQEVQTELNASHNIDIQEILNTSENLEHHDFSKRISEEACTFKEVLEADAVRSYINIKGESYFRDLMEKIDSEL
jgi:predicted ATPase